MNIEYVIHTNALCVILMYLSAKNNMLLAYNSVAQVYMFKQVYKVNKQSHK